MAFREKTEINIYNFSTFAKGNLVPSISGLMLLVWRSCGWHPRSDI